MFDDPTLSPQGASIPENLPTGDIEDIFHDTDSASASPPPSLTQENAPNTAPLSAVEAGLLKPKVQTSETAPVAPTVERSRPAKPEPESSPYRIQSPTVGRRILFLAIAAVVLLVIGGGGMWIYVRIIRVPQTDFQPSPVLPAIAPSLPFAPSQPVGGAAASKKPSGSSVPSGIAEEVVEEQVLFGEPVDVDGDGLDILKEQELQTNPTLWDTDKDELGDGDEVLIWKTDPLNPDTDGDTYLDGVEIKNGYSPTGPGKIFEPPSDAQ